MSWSVFPWVCQRPRGLVRSPDCRTAAPKQNTLKHQENACWVRLSSAAGDFTKHGGLSMWIDRYFFAKDLPQTAGIFPVEIMDAGVIMDSGFNGAQQRFQWTAEVRAPLPGKSPPTVLPLDVGQTRQGPSSNSNIRRHLSPRCFATRRLKGPANAKDEQHRKTLNIWILLDVQLAPCDMPFGAHASADKTI